jgi:hypothetical protein
MTDGFAVRILDGTNKDPTAQVPAGSAGLLAFDLEQLLAAIGDAAFHLKWTCSDVDCFGGRAEELYSLAESGEAISGRELFEIARTVTQVIDGQFLGREPGSGDLAVDIRAIDSSWWEVRSRKPQFIDAMRAQFRAVETIDFHAA